MATTITSIEGRLEEYVSSLAEQLVQRAHRSPEELDDYRCVVDSFLAIFPEYKDQLQRRYVSSIISSSQKVK